MNESLRDRVAIVGVGDVDYGALYRDKDCVRDADELAAAAFREALADAGLTRDDVDGLLCSRVSGYRQFATLVGMRHLRVVNWYEPTGRMSGLAVQTAALAIAAGLADVVACVYGNNGRSARARYGGFGLGQSTSAREAPVLTDNPDQLYGMTSPGAYTGLMYQRYASEYNVPDGALAPVAISNRYNATLNPRAVRRTPLDLETYISSRYIAEPLRREDYCLINDGAVVLILTTAERARELRKPPVLISSTATVSDFSSFQNFSFDYRRPAGRAITSKLYDDAGVVQSDVACLQIYDPFTPHVLFALEAFNFCEPGTAWEWVKDGHSQVGGALPVNTSGGHTAESYMQGWNLHAEAVRQVRGECGERQVPDCQVAQYITEGPIVASHILRRG